MTIDAAIDRAGFSAPAFPTIVASGPNSAHPHARPDGAPARGGRPGGAGLRRGFGRILRRLDADGRARSGRCARRGALRCRAGGAGGGDRGRARRDRRRRRSMRRRGTCSTARGFGDAFLHATGHGLGLEVHEAPRISRADSGSTGCSRGRDGLHHRTGAYLDGLGGVRLEDDVLVTAEGCEVLTDAPRDLLVV